MELPVLFLEQMKALLGEEEYKAYIESFEQKRVYGLRVNTMKLSTEKWEEIDPFETDKIPWVDNGYYYEGTKKPGKHPYYFAGMYYLQEPSAMTPANRLPINKGDKVLDLCAAPGGKSTELAAKLDGTGLLVSNDISNSRAKALLKNLELFGTSNSIIMSESPHRLAEKFPEFFDKILIDAPCSGEGMFRKEPSVIKSWVQNGTDFYEKLQREIVTYALAMLKPGGMLLYSTCTFNAGEDEGTVAFMREICPELKILPMEQYEGFAEGRPDVIPKESKDYGNEEFKKCVRIFPHKMNGEGHFVALLQKGESVEEVSYNKSSNSNKKKQDKYRQNQSRKMAKPNRRGGEEDTTANAMEDFWNFIKDTKLELEASRVELRGENLLYMPEVECDLQGLRILRSGLLLGECKKNHFEPSQALAMSLKMEDYKHCINLSVEDERVIKYLKGETLDVEDLVSKSLKGWQLVCVDGFPLGFAKGAGYSLKNKYLAGWRWQ